MTTSSSSQQQERLAITLSRSPKTPGSRNGGSSFSDETIWMRLRDAGFDEESIKRRDKAALIAYIAKLESEVFDYQHNMGLLILERKDWTTKYEQVKASTDSTELRAKFDQAAHLSALAEARKREESLKKALGIEKECIANIEKTLHEMRAESAETKVAAENKMNEACNMVEDAQKKLLEAETKLHTAECLQAEANRYHRAAERKIQEVEEREDELRRRLISFKSECDAKEKEISLERQSLFERQKIIQQEQERLLDGQAQLNQREEYIFGRSDEINLLEKQLEASKATIEKESRALDEKKLSLNLQLAALSTREESVIEREVLLNKKEQELLITQEKLAIKEHDEIQRRITEHEATLERRKSEFQAELETKRKLMENEMDAKRRVCELREVDLTLKEELIGEKEHELDVQSKGLIEKEKDTKERFKSIEEKEEHLNAAEKVAELEKLHIQKEKEDIENMKLDLQKSMVLLDNKIKEVQEAQEKLEATKSEKDELSVLEMKLKEEIDSIRAQRIDLMAEADELKAEKSKFEAEWESMDEKRAELQKEEELVAEERKSISKFLKDERENLKLEKEALRDQFKNNVDSLFHEKAAFTSKMEVEHSEWFSNIEQERSNLLSDIEMQKRELENCIEKRREEIEIYLNEREESFEQEKKKELQYINSQKEMVAKEQEEVTLKMKRLEKERVEIMLEREQRAEEETELKKSIDELQVQREKLKEQRELLHSDREKIVGLIEHLNELENLKEVSEKSAQSEKHQANLKYSRRRAPAIPAKEHLDLKPFAQDVDLSLPVSKHASDDASPPISTPFSWIRRCTKLIFKNAPEKIPDVYRERSLISDFEDAKLLEDKYSQETQRKFKSIPRRYVNEEQRVLQGTSVGAKIKASCDVESVTETDVTESCVHAYPEQGILSRRKRGDDSSSNGNGDHKKRRQHKDAPEIPIEDITSNCAVSTPTPPPEDDGGLTSLNKTAGDPEKAGNVIDDRHNTEDDTTENQGTNTCFEQAKFVSSQNSLLALDHGKLLGRDSDGCAHSPRTGNGVLSNGSKAEGRLQEVVLGSDIVPAKEGSQPLGEVATEKTSQKYDDHGELTSEEDGRVDKNEEKMTIKQQL